MTKKKSTASAKILPYALDDDDPLAIPEFLRAAPGSRPPMTWDQIAKPKVQEFYVNKEIPNDVKRYLVEKEKEEKIRTQNRIAKMKMGLQAKKVDRSQQTWDGKKGRWVWAIPPWPMVRYNKDGSVVPYTKEANMTNVDFGTTPAKKAAKAAGKKVLKAKKEAAGKKGKKTAAATTRAAGDGPYGSRIGTNKEKLLTILSKGKAVKITECIKAIYGNVKVDDKMGALPGVIAGAEVALKAAGKTLIREGRGNEATLKIA